MTTLSMNTSTEYTQIYNYTQHNETNGQTNFLNLLIIRNPFNLEIDIHRKPTTMNTTINYTSNHPKEHKTAAYRYHITRMHSLPLTTE